MGKIGFMDKFIQCPYFRRFEEKQICCEGVDGASTTRMSFRNMKDMKAYAFRTCATMEYGLCPLARGITEYLEANMEAKNDGKK